MFDEDDDINPFEEPDYENVDDDEARGSNQLMQVFLGVIALVIIVVLILMPLWRVIG